MFCRILLVASLAPLAGAQQRQRASFDARGQPQRPAPQALHDVLLQVFDKNFDKKVSADELSKTLDSFAEMSGMFAPPEPGAPNKIKGMIDAAKKVAPSIFKILDKDDSKGLDKDELTAVTLAQAKFMSGAMRNLTRDVFDTIDVDPTDSELTAAELTAAADVDGAILEKIVELVHAAFPVRKDAAELKALLLEAVAAVGTGMADGVALIDGDGDGSVSRKEAGQAFKKAKQMFMEATKTLQEMGPMLAMFGGADGGMGGGPMGGMGAMGGMPRGGGRGGRGGRGGAR